MKKFSFIRFCAVLSLAALLVGCAPQETPASSEPSAHRAAEVRQLFSLQEPEVCTDSVTAEACGNLLLLTCARPGLDTCALTLLLYDRADWTQLCRLDVEEGLWDCGCLPDGFYLADLAHRYVTIYGTDGAVRQTALCGRPQESWHMAVPSDDGKYICYAEVTTAELRLYDIAARSESVVGAFSGWIEKSRWQDGAFHLISPNALLRADPQEGTLRPLYYDTRLSYFSDGCCVGVTEDGFLVYDRPQGKLWSVNTGLEREAMLLADPAGFVTVTEHEDGERLHRYRMSDRIAGDIWVPGTFRQVLPLEDGQLLVLYAENGQAGITVALADPFEREPYLFSASDVTQRGQEATPVYPLTERPQDAGKDLVLIEGVPIIPQMPQYPTGCESVSTVMALRFAGEDISVDTFIDFYLPRLGGLYERDGVFYGPDPEKSFIGDPRDAASFGCMSPVIRKALISYYGSDAMLTDATGSTLKQLCTKYIDRGRPVIVWTSLDMIEPYRTRSWILPDGSEYSWLSASIVCCWWVTTKQTIISATRPPDDWCPTPKS